MHRIRVIDSHTEGEPTRVIIEGGPDLGGGSMAERRARFQQEFDRYRSAWSTSREDRTSSSARSSFRRTTHRAWRASSFSTTSALLACEGMERSASWSPLAHLGRLNAGLHRIDTPAGVVTAELHESGDVSVRSVPSYRLAKDVVVDVDG
jgi:proline racemase